MHPKRRIAAFLAGPLCLLLQAPGARAESTLGAFSLSLPPALAAEAPPVGKAGAAKPKGKPALIRTVDLSSQFEDGPRRQKDVASCHAFTTVALLEAAYYRKYGERKRFSEADLFLQRTVLDPDIYLEFVLEGAPVLSETQMTAADIRYALRNGIASSLKYKDFLKRYRRYRSAEQRTLEGLSKLAEEPGDDEGDDAEPYDAAAHWSDIQMEPQAKRILEAYLTGNRGDELARERRANRRKFKGFRLQQTEFDPDTDLFAEEGRPQAAAIKAELDAARPVGTSMSSHVFVVIGYREYSDSRIVFQTRDSDGSKDLCPKDFGKISRIYSVREK